MPAPRNLKGQRFERLIVLRRAKIPTKNKQAIWECECDCGKIKDIGSKYLIAGTTKSCGCLKAELISQFNTDNNAEKNRKRAAGKPKKVQKKKVSLSPAWYCRDDNIPAEKFEPRTANTDSQHKTLIELEYRECHWPDEERNADGLITFCACRTYYGNVYCEAHEKLKQGFGTPSERAAHRVGKRELA